jgi:hypothetical protein
MIVLQAAVLIYLSASTPKINHKLDQVLVFMGGKPAPSQYLQPVWEQVYSTIYSFQELNVLHHWLFWLVGGIGFFYLCCFYSLYIHFLRMGHSWTKLLLHLNNLTPVVLLPVVLWLNGPAFKSLHPSIGILWVLGYVAGTRVFKHFCVTSSFAEENYTVESNI